MNKRFILVLAWALIVGALVCHNLYLFMGKQIEPDTDILALLPVEKQDPVLQNAFKHMVETSEQRIIVLVGAREWHDTVKASNAYENIIIQHPDLLQIAVPDTETTQNEWLPLFSQYRHHLLTSEQQQNIKNQSSAYWIDLALAKLYSPFGGSQLIPWQKDPFDLFNGWAQKRMQETTIRPRDGKLFVSDDNLQYAVIPLVIKSSAFSLDTQKNIIPLLNQARKNAQDSETQIDILTAGVLLHAAAASEQAHQEISTIGLGSMIGIVLLIWFTFRSIKPIVLISLSLITGVLGALSVCHLIYGQIHILTLVFGASLIGIAQDYSIYYLCNRANLDDKRDSWTLIRQLLPGMALTLSTTVIGYLGLTLTPFPGLRQMAIFAAAGLIFAWFTVILWFPFFTHANTFKRNPGWHAYQRSIHYWPKAALNKPTLIVSILFILVVLFGLSRLQVNDDLRLLQNPNTNLIEQQKKITALLDIPAMVQFFLVRGETPQQVLEREETLTQELEPLVEKQTIRGYQSISNWIPSIKAQKANRILIENNLYNSTGPYTQLQSKTGLKSIQLDHTETNRSYISIDQFLSTSNSDAFKYLWLGKIDDTYASIITIRGLSRENMSRLSQIPDKAEGIQWVDKVDEISSVLGHYRHYMGWVVIAAYGVIYLLLSFRYREDTWRVVLPPLIASIATLSIMGIIGKDLHLFNTLAFMLILGIGVDSGIFFQENANNKKEAIWLEIGLSALTTLFSFGLLSLSSTPALHSFGFTMLIGITLVWMTVPCFRKNQ